jgi:hypothetical protein
MASSGGFGAIGGMCFFAAGSILSLLMAAAFSGVVLEIVAESSEGNREIKQWPHLLDLPGSLLYIAMAGSVSAIPGAAISRIPIISAHPVLAGAAIAAAALLCLPVVLLSQLDINSPWGILSGRVLASMRRCPFSWAFFYIEGAILVAICGAATVAVAGGGPGAILSLAPLYMLALILFARLLGRLAWRLSEAMAEETLA